MPSVVMLIVVMLIVIMLIVVMLIVVMLIVFMLIVVMLSVLAPLKVGRVFNYMLGSWAGAMTLCMTTFSITTLGIKVHSA